MLKVVGESQDGKKILGIGLSRMNLLKLQQGLPLDVDLEALSNHPFSHVFIFFGEDEPLMIEMMSAMSDANTVVKIDPRVGNH